METERLIELLRITKEYIEIRDNEFQFGICKAMENIYYCSCKCSFDEYVELKKYIFANKPTPDNQYKDFYNNSYWRDNGFWWIPINKQPRTKQIRINFLTELINNLK